MYDNETTQLLIKYDKYLEEFNNTLFYICDALVCECVELNDTHEHEGVTYEGRLLYVINGAWHGLLLDNGDFHMYNGEFTKYSRELDWEIKQRKALTEDDEVVHCYNRYHHSNLKLKPMDFGWWYDSTQSEVAF